MNNAISGSLEGTILFLATVVVAVLVAQTILMALFVIAFRRWSDKTSAKLDAIANVTVPAVQSLRELVDDSRQRFNTIGANLEEISTMTSKQVQRIDGVVSDASERAQYQLVRLDSLVSDTITKVEVTSDAIQRGVVRPVQEISAILAGVKVAIDFLRRRNRHSIDRATHDEEMFI
ncbi:MAG: hypothetical protein EXQ56_04800 [Acidobacteria bacterium]|nr:hypothetical protein [Acidobacteriota bacterium]